jgi:hypothetical protein
MATDEENIGEKQSTLSRQEKRKLERDSEKLDVGEMMGGEDITEEELRKGEQRPPRRSSRLEGSDDLSVIDNPGDLFSDPGQDLDSGRFDQIRDSGALDPLVGSSVFQTEQRKLNDQINAFVAWQAKQDDYIIYLNAGYDPQKKKDRWIPKRFRFNPLTVGNQLKMNRMAALVDDLRRAVQNNDVRIANANIRLQETVEKLMKLQCELFFRMNIEKEFMISHFNDLNLMIQAAIYCSAQVPQSQKTRWSSSSSKDQPQGIS